MIARAVQEQPTALPLTGSGARVVFGAYFAMLIVLAIWTIGGITEPWRVVVGLAIESAILVVLLLDRRTPIGLAATTFVLVTVPMVDAVLAWQGLYIGYNTWFIGTGAVAMYYLSLRGRIGLAWLGFGVHFAMLLVWSMTGGPGFSWWLFTMAQHALILFVGTMYAVGLRRTNAAILILTAESSSRAAAAAAQQALTAERSARRDELEQTVAPLLALIASDAPLGEGDRQAFLLAEAELRDGLRARGLRTPEVIAGVRDARARGLEVVLLDDSGGGTQRPALAEFADTLVTAVGAARDGRVTARLLPADRALVGTIVVDGTAYARHDVPRDGERPPA